MKNTMSTKVDYTSVYIVVKSNSTNEQKDESYRKEWDSSLFKTDIK